MLMAGLWVFAFATRGLISPQSKVWVGIVFGSTSFDGIGSSLFMAWGAARQPLEPSDPLGVRPLGGQPLHARGAEQAAHPLLPLEPLVPFRPPRHPPPPPPPHP